MRDSAARMMKANNRLINAETDEERELAQEEFLKAEREHLEKIGVRLQPGWAWLAPTLLTVLLLVTLLIGIGTSSRQNDLAANLAEEQRLTCERGNDSRAAALQERRNEVDNLRADLTNLRGDIDYLRTTGLTRPFSDASVALLEVKREAIMAKERAIRQKKVSIARIIEAQAPAAVKPGSVRVEC